MQAGGNDRLFLRDHFEDPVLAVLDVENELAQERLVILLAQHLVALREVVAFLHLEPLQGLDQLHGVLAAFEARLLHADLEGVHGLVVRLHVAVRQRPGRVDLLQTHHRIVEELLVVRGVERGIHHRHIAVDADEAFDLAPSAGKVVDSAMAPSPAILYFLVNPRS